MNSAVIVVYVIPLAAVFALYVWRLRRRDRASRAILAESLAAGLVEPPSLHPRIDPSKCLGCGTCVPACPEKNVLGLVAGKARLVSPSNCIGHGACATACPQDAITLVLGTERRGVEIPVVGPDFQTNVEGIFVAGELGGMGLIRNAIEQGRQAVDAVREAVAAGRSRAADLDLVIVGAGPAGFSASLAAMHSGLRFVTLEQESLGGTVAHYPRGKIVMTAPAVLPGVGELPFRETTKETLLEFWRDVERRTGIGIRYGERVEAVGRAAGAVEVRTAGEVHRARAVLLAIGRRGTPRKLGVPGEELPKVVYRLIDPEQYRRQRVLVVGGGDSALEAAASVAEETDTSVTLSYRSAAFGRAKPKNRARVDALSDAGRLRVELESQVGEIERDSVRLETRAGPARIGNDSVIVCAGGVLPTAFLESAGVEMETKRGTSLR